ncbi:related to MRM2 - mitochondrial rRNA methyl transferase [Ustilago sp. UG-2017b]|nr:related to MRM2 - mitochondrial rRNA methyl transferase [Ustilago sp. UG-2017b]
MTSSSQLEEDSDEVVGKGYVSRSAFKILQLDNRYRFLRAGRVIVDLGAAPGGWSQAMVERASKGRNKMGDCSMTGRMTRVFALDLLPVIGIEGVQSIQGDFLDPAVQGKLRQMVQDATVTGECKGETGGNQGFVDIVVSDMMANTTGNRVTDTEASLELCRTAARFSFQTLKRDNHLAKQVEGDTCKPRSLKSLAAKSSVLVLKHFMSHEADVFRKEVLQKHFHLVKAEKMNASRKESREQFWVCIGYKGPLSPRSKQ